MCYLLLLFVKLLIMLLLNVGRYFWPIFKYNCVSSSVNAIKMLSYCKLNLYSQSPRKFKIYNMTLSRIISKRRILQVYWVGPVLGGCIATLLYKFLFMPHRGAISNEEATHKLRMYPFHIWKYKLSNYYFAIYFIYHNYHIKIHTILKSLIDENINVFLLINKYM